MPRPTNHELKRALRDRKATLIAEGNKDYVTVLCTEFGLARNTIFYHLKEPNADGRLKYTQEQRAYLAERTADELRKIAAKTGRSFHALQRLAHRERDARGIPKKDPARISLELQGFFDWHKVPEMHLFGLTAQDYIGAKNLLSGVFGLRLVSPNILSHTATGRALALTWEEQAAIMKDPRGFLTKNARELSVRWRSL